MSLEQEYKLYHFRLGKDMIADHDFKDQLNHVSSFINHQCNSENLNFLIGSGCSLPAVPLMGQTFDKIKPETEIEMVLGEFKNSDDIEGYMNWLKNALIFYGEDKDDSNYKRAFGYAKNALINTIPKEYTIRDNEEEKDVGKTLKNYSLFYNSIFNQREYKKHSPVNVFTTNYDLFNEVAMERSGIHYTNGFRGQVSRSFDPSLFRLRLVDDENRYKEKWSVVRRYIKLHKIHGSIDWIYDPNLENIVQSNYYDSDTENIMIYPTIDKHFETQQSPYSELIREFTTALQKRDSTLILIGYGFPDDHINQLIAQALNNEDFTLIVFGDSTEEKLSNFQDKHKDRDNFHLIGGSFGAENNGHHFGSVIEYLGGGY